MVFRVCPTVGALMTLKGLPFLTALWLSDVSNKEGGRKDRGKTGSPFFLSYLPQGPQRRLYHLHLTDEARSKVEVF